MIIKMLFKVAFCLSIPWALFAEEATDTISSISQGQKTIDGQVQEPDSLPPIEKMPVLKEFIKAQYPIHLSKQGIQGTVILDLLVNEQGTIDSITIVKGIHKDLDAEAVKAVKKFQYTPAIAGGTAVPVIIQYEYRFTLDQIAVTNPDRINLEGILIEKGTRQPIGDANVIITFTDTTSDSTLPLPFSLYLMKIGSTPGQSYEENHLLATTDSTGKFAFRALPSVPVSLSVIAPGYEEFRTNETIQQNESLSVKYYIKRSSYSDYEIVVYGKTEEKEVSRRQLTFQEIKKIPGLSGDAVKVVQALPGVSRPSFASGDVIVRGSPTSNSRFFLDGVDIPVLYHFGGLKSAYNSDALAGIDFYPGGFGVTYGGALAGVVELKGREAASDRWHGYLDMSTIDGSALVEGPINKKVSVLATARRSVIGDIAEWLVNKNKDQFGFSLLMNYYDYVFRTDYKLSKNNKMFLTFFGSFDSLELVEPEAPPGSSDEISDNANKMSNKVYQHMAIFGWDVAFGKIWENTTRASVALGEMSLAQYGYFKNKQGGEIYYLRDQLTLNLNDKVKAKAGADIQYTSYDVNLSTIGASRAVHKEKIKNWNFGVMGAYLALELKPLQKLTFSPGIRYDYYPELIYDGSIVPEFWDYTAFNNNRGFSGEPSLRVSGRYALTEMQTIKLSIGNYSQTPQPMGEVIHKTWGEPSLPTTKAAHYVAGHEWQISDLLSSDIQFYFNSKWNIPEYATGEDLTAQSDRQKNYTDRGRGKMYGMEILLKRLQGKHFSGWISYSLSRAERYDRKEHEWFLTRNDETHNLQILNSWKLRKEWDLGYRLRYVTGKPETPIVGFTVLENDDYYQPIWGKKNSARLDPFFQIDLRVDKKFIYKKWMYSLYLDMQNVSYFFYKSPETTIYNFNYKEKATIAMIPLIGIGCKAEF
jgi:TonB family protein